MGSREHSVVTRTVLIPEMWSVSCSAGAEQGLCVPGSELPLILEQIRRSSGRSMENLALEMCSCMEQFLKSNPSTTNKAIMLLESDIFSTITQTNFCSRIQQEFLERQDNDLGIAAGLSIVQ